jgi:hypothetical protein
VPGKVASTSKDRAGCLSQSENGLASSESSRAPNNSCAERLDRRGETGLFRYDSLLHVIRS